MEMNPQLAIHFETDDNGEPRYVLGEDGKKHYKLVLEVQNAPDDAYAATFELDSTYYDPVRSVTPDTEGKLQLRTTSYGNYPLRVSLTTKRGGVAITDSVVRALQRARPEMPDNPSVDDAILELSKL